MTWTTTSGRLMLKCRTCHTYVEGTNDGMCWTCDREEVQLRSLRHSLAFFEELVNERRVLRALSVQPDPLSRPTEPPATEEPQP